MFMPVILTERRWPERCHTHCRRELDAPAKERHDTPLAAASSSCRPSVNPDLLTVRHSAADKPDALAKGCCGPSVARQARSCKTLHGPLRFCHDPGPSKPRITIERFPCPALQRPATRVLL